MRTPTFDGLVRFDGVRFTTFGTGNTKGIVNNRFTGDLGYDVVNATARGRYLSVSLTRKW